MQVKSYRATSIREAMARIKEDLGPEAVVLSSKRISEGPIPLMEVLAARDDGRTAVMSGSDDMASALSALKREIEELKELKREWSHQEGAAELTALKEGLSALFDVIGIRHQGKSCGPLARVYNRLTAEGIAKDQAVRIAESVRSQASPGEGRSYEILWERAKGVIEDHMKDSWKKSVQRRIKFLVGPTGAGKTTTLAKLAARHRLERKQSVGVVTLDTYRIAAPEQLKIYADIIDVPLAVAADASSFREALGVFADRDVILVDTPGTSMKDDRFSGTLKEILSSTDGGGADLVLSVTESQEHLRRTIERFEGIRYDSLIFTKIDEEERYGAIYNILRHVGKPAHVIANGQAVPTDLIEADPARVMALVVGERFH
ncbi:MAG: flagellar biosynthesis protein FlhF [Deltaproteobacteria bacterium]|nr:flagellar biosynthesis protein FlhF [Deltaproteobacteria bacterium]